MTHPLINEATEAPRDILPIEEITTAVKRVFDVWIGSDCSTPGNPINEYIDDAVWYMRHAPRRGPDEATDTSGDGPGGKVGSAIRAYESAQRTIEHCSHCPYYGYCPGRFVADATRQQQQFLAQSGCPVRNMVRHIVVRLQPRRVSGSPLPTPARKIQNRAFGSGGERLAFA